MKFNFKIALSVFVFFLTVSSRQILAQTIEQKFHGDYIGVSFHRITQDSSFEENLLTMKIDEKGLHQTRIIGNHSFEVFYSPDWLFSSQERLSISPGFSENTLAIKQNPRSRLAQAVFHFPNSLRKGLLKLANWAKLTSTPAYILEVVGEGTPTPLAVFTHNDPSGKGKEDLKRVYRELQAKQVQKNGEEENERSYLKPIHLPEDLKALESAETSFQQKAEIIDRAEANLWTGTSEEISERLSLFKFVIEKSNDAKLIQYALEQSQMGAQVSGIVPMIITAINASLEHNDSELLNSAVDAAIVHLREANNEHTVITSALTLHGTEDISQIHEITGGKITIEDAELLEKLVSLNQKSQNRRYSLHHLESLVDALKRAQASPALNELHAKKIEDALKKHTSPYFCELLLQ